MTPHPRIEAQLAGIAMGDRDALRDLYTLTAPQLFGICLRILRDRAEAEDTLQTVFCTLWQGGGSGGGDAGRFVGQGVPGMVGLLTLTRDMAVQRLRAAPATKRPAAPDPDLFQTSGAAPTQPSGQGMSRLAQCLRDLPSDRAAMIRRAYLDGDGYDALARAAGVRADTLRPWLRRTLMQLRDTLSR